LETLGIFFFSAFGACGGWPSAIYPKILLIQSRSFSKKLLFLFPLLSGTGIDADGVGLGYPEALGVGSGVLLGIGVVSRVALGVVVMLGEMLGVLIGVLEGRVACGGRGV